MKSLLLLFLTAVAPGLALGQAPSSLAGFTIYSDAFVNQFGTEGQTAIDLRPDGTYAIRFALVAAPGNSAPGPVFLGQQALYESSGPNGTYTYAVVQSNVGGLSLSGSALTGTVGDLQFSNSYQGTIPVILIGGGTSKFSLVPTGGEPSKRALVNISTMITAAPGSPATIGFVVGGTRAREILVRAVGPSLAQFGITNFAPNPGYMLNGGLAFQLPGESGQFPATGWSATPASSAILSAEANRAGAFPLLPNSNDKADVVLLNPGAYTITVNPLDQSGKGTELVEVYEVE